MWKLLGRIPTRVAATLITILALVSGGVAAHAAPPSADPIIRSGELLAAPVSPDGSRITDFRVQGPQTVQLKVHAAAMNRDVLIDVQRPADASKPRPTLYLLNGEGGGEDSATWTANTDVLTFLATKNVNVVQPIGGAFTYYADWVKTDPRLGVNKWRTFFTDELPPLIDAALGTNHVNAIAGLSTSGTAVLNLPESKPGLYKAVAAYSGCAQSADPLGHTAMYLAVNIWGAGDIDNMYGPYGAPGWAANDPYLNAGKLRGLDLFISSGSGLPGPYDVLNGKYTLPGVDGLEDQLFYGSIIEATVNHCTHRLAAKLNSLGIPATYDFRPTGTHSWGYWRDAFYQSWPVLAKGLNLP